MTRRTRPSLHDQAGLIGKLAVFWILALLLVGLLVLDGISIVLATLRLSETAQTAASAAATQFHNGHEATKACEAAEVGLAADGVPVPGNERWCRIDSTSGEATIVLHSTASSLVLGRLSLTRDYTEVNARETAEPAL